MKSLLQRLLLPSYLKKTIQVKQKRLLHNLLQKNNPYETIYPKVEKKETEIIPRFEHQYHSFSYINLETAQQYYKNKKSTIHTIMLALFEYNEMQNKNAIDTTRLEELAQEIIGLGEVEGYYLYFYVDESIAQFDVEGRGISGIIQAKAASFLLRCFEATENDNYLSWARMSILACKKKVSDKGVFRTLHNNMIWVEEYPSPSPSMVLNGYSFFVIAVIEYCGLVSDPEIEELMSDSHSSLISWLPYYFVGNHMLYSMYHWSFCNIHYLSVCQYQVEHLYKITSLSIYKQYADRLSKMTDDATFKKLFI